METLECIHTRRSIRRYSEAEVEWEKIGKILEAGTMAPSAGNLQDWKFIVVTEESTREAIAKACMEQTWMAFAPVHIIVCSEPSNTERHYGIRGLRLYTIQNSAAAIQNMLLAAHDLGLGSCWVGAFEEELVRQHAGIPDNVRPQGIITVGYAIEKPKMPIKKELYEVVFIESYRNRIKDMNQAMRYKGMILQDNIQKFKEKVSKGSEALPKEKMKKALKKVKKMFIREK